jgi:cytochrome P450
MGQPLGADAIASILRNWTVGEIGTISAAVGILAQWLAEHADLQATLRAERPPGSLRPSTKSCACMARW